MQIGWANSLTNSLKEAGELEKELVNNLFVDPGMFLKSIITIMIDETLGRDNLAKVVKVFNKKTPFLMLNDLRVAMATNSLRRVEVIKSLIMNDN